MKRGLLGFPLLIFLIQAVSAQFFSGYGRFSITDFFNSIEPSTITLSLLFFIFFALIFYTLSRVFKDQYGQPNRGVAGTISLAVSLLIVYGIYRSGFNLGDLFYNLGIGAEILYLIGSIIFIVLAIFLIRKIRFCGFLIVFGLFLILLTMFTEIFYEKLVAILIGFILLVIGLLLCIKRKRKLTGYGYDYGSSPRGPRTLSRKREKRRELGDVKYGQRIDYKKQKVEQKYQRKLHGGEVKRRAKNIVKIRGRREKPERKRQRELEKAQRGAYKEEARRQRKQQAQEEIQQINNEIERLRQMIPSASVIERGKIEDQIRAYEKRAKKLR